MNISFLGKKVKVSEGMREHIREKLLKLDRYAPRLVEAHVVVKKEKYVYIIEVTLLAKNLRAYGEGSSKENVFTATDQACARIEKQLKRYREKQKDHHKHDHAGPDLRSVLFAAEEPEPVSGAAAVAVETRVIRARSMAAKPMSVEEASLQLGVSKKPFLVFQNAANKKFNVIFKREDGHHGLIDPEF